MKITFLFLSSSVYLWLVGMTSIVMAGAAEEGMMSSADRYGLSLTIAVLAIGGAIFIIKQLWGLHRDDLNETKDRVAVLEGEQRSQLENRLRDSISTEKELTTALQSICQTVASCNVTLTRLEGASLDNISLMQRRPCQWLESIMTRLENVNDSDEFRMVLKDAKEVDDARVAAENSANSTSK